MQFLEPEFHSASGVMTTECNHRSHQMYMVVAIKSHAHFGPQHGIEAVTKEQKCFSSGWAEDRLGSTGKSLGDFQWISRSFRLPEV